jgi:hypothetical protein
LCIFTQTILTTVAVIIAVTTETTAVIMVTEKEIVEICKVKVKTEKENHIPCCKVSSDPEDGTCCAVVITDMVVFAEALDCSGS